MDRVLTLQRKTTTQDTYGEPIETWATIATVWAEKKDLRGSELFAAQQFMAGVETIFKIRYRVGMTPLDRVVCEGETYDVSAVIEIGRREGQEIYCSARTE